MRAFTAVATAAVIATAAWMWHNLPTPDDVFAPFDVRVGMGQRAAGYAVSATVSGVRIGPQVRKEQYRPMVVDAVGLWVVVDGEAVTTRSDEVLTVELIVGPNTYRPTHRIGVMPLAGSLAPGIAMRGSWAFDVPADLVAPGGGKVTLQMWVDDWRLDSRLVIDMDLDDARVQRTDLIRIEPATQVGT